jgi:hypothetical protein
MLPTLEDKIYFRAATRTQDHVESDLSKQVTIEPYPVVSLGNRYFLMNVSEGLDKKHPIEHLWDRCIEDVPECTAGSNKTDSIKIEFDLKDMYMLQYASLFGDTEGKWRSRSWSLAHKIEKNDPWQPAFTNLPVNINDWIKQDLRNVLAQYVQVEIFGEPGTNAVQARELEIIGRKMWGK